MSHNRSQTYNERSAGRHSPSPTKRKRFLSLPGLNVAKANKPQWSEQVLQEFGKNSILSLYIIKLFNYITTVYIVDSFRFIAVCGNLILTVFRINKKYFK